jgi:hypothetical protein
LEEVIVLDVHPPHGKMAGFRDFLLHLFTITVGLLIALALEGWVERLHNHEVRDQADANLRQEIRDNAKEIEESRKNVLSEQESMKKMLPFLEARKAGKNYDIHEVRLSYKVGQLQDASWKTAAATGALGYMEYGHVQRYAEVYQLQEKYSTFQDETISEYLQLQSFLIFGFDPAKLSPADAASAETDARRTLTHLVAMEQIGTELGKEYEKVLAEK